MKETTKSATFFNGIFERFEKFEMQLNYFSMLRPSAWAFKRLKSDFGIVRNFFGEFLRVLFLSFHLGEQICLNLEAQRA